MYFKEFHKSIRKQCSALFCNLVNFCRINGVIENYLCVNFAKKILLKYNTLQLVRLN